MSVPHDANLANFEELEGHCKLLSAKLSSLTSGNAPVQTAIEDLEDYYERAVQMRVMHNTTLKEEIFELKKKHSETMGNIFSAIGVFCGGFFFLGAEEADLSLGGQGGAIRQGAAWSPPPNPPLYIKEGKVLISVN